eukprot:scaffold19193_cov62-Phaeocystis_antarctica.AAC.1
MLPSIASTTSPAHSPAMSPTPPCSMCEITQPMRLSRLSRVRPSSPPGALRRSSRCEPTSVLAVAKPDQFCSMG